MQKDDSKTVNGITVDIHRITIDTVYFARTGATQWPGDEWPLRAEHPSDEWPLYQMNRAEFERLWEAEI